MLASKGSMAQRAKAMHSRLVHWRRDFHIHPELSFREYRTAREVVKILRQVPGMKVTSGVGGTGVVGVLDGGRGPAIALRADMDALPIDEAAPPPYRSRTAGVMHACGHDAHTAMLLGAACLLGEVFAEKELRGRIKFLFQPAEESPGPDGLTGAPRMIADGALEDVDAVVALHVMPGLPVGAVQLNDGYTTASVDTFEGTLFGTGGHGAYPHLGTDPVWMMLPVLQAIHGIVSRRVSPLEPAVVSVGRIQAGGAHNVIPPEVSIQGTLRSFHPEVREQLIGELERAFALVKALGGDYRLQVIRGEPALYNDSGINGLIRSVIEELYPDCSIHAGPFGLGGEDFSHMTRKVPGAMFFLGCAMDDGVQRDLHTPIFDLNEECLSMGAAILAEVARRYLEQGV